MVPGRLMFALKLNIESYLPLNKIYSVHLGREKLLAWFI
jgi:hypothetical protein